MKIEDEDRDSFNYLKAVCTLKSDTRDYNKALQLLDNIKPLNMTNDSEFLKYFCYFKMQNYEMIVKYHLTNEEKFQKLNENFKMMIAISYEKLNLTNNAKQIYKEIIDANPNNKQAVNNLSILDMKNSNSSESISHLKKCHQTFPKNLAIANNYAQCLIKNKMIDEGLEVYEKIIEMNSNSSNLSLKVKNLFEKVKKSFLANLIKFGKFDSAEKLIKENIYKNNNTILDINSVKFITETHISNNKLNRAYEFVKYLIESYVWEDRKALEELKKLFREIQNIKLLSKSSGENNKSQPKNFNHIEISKEIEFSIETLEHRNRRGENISNCSQIKETFEENENSVTISEINDINPNKEQTSLLDKDCEQDNMKETEGTKLPSEIFDANLSPSEVNNNNNIIHNYKEKEKVETESILESPNAIERKKIDDNDILDKILSRSKKNKSKSSESMLKIDEKKPLSNEEILREILSSFNKSDYNKCREYINLHREKFKGRDSNYDIKQIACISAKLFYHNNECDKASLELKDFYKELDEENLKLLINASRRVGLSIARNCDDYLNYLEELYNKFHTNEDTLLELIIASVGVRDKYRVEKYIITYLKSKQGEVLNEVYYEKILNIILYQPNFQDCILKIIKEIKRLFGASALYYFTFGRFNLINHNINQAYENFMKIETLINDNPFFLKYLSKVYIKLGYYKKAVKSLKKVLNINKSDWNSALLIGKCFISLLDHQKASKYISIACKSHMKYETSFKINFAKGLLEYEMKNYSNAFKYFDKCKELQPTNFKVIHFIALILSKNSEIVEAERVFENILLQKENYFPSIFELFKIKIFLNKRDQGDDLIKKIENFEELSPLNSMEYALILLKYYGDYNRSIKYFDDSVKRGKNTVINQAMEYAEFLQTKQDYTNTIKAYKLLLKTCEKDYRIFKGLKNIFSELKLYDEGIKTLETYIRYKPNSVEANSDLGDLNFYKQNYHKAIEYFLMSCNLNKLHSENKFIFLKKKIAICQIFLKLYETSYKNFEAYSKIRIEKNIFLLMSYIKFLYFDCVEEANFLLKVIYEI